MKREAPAVIDGLRYRIAEVDALIVSLLRQRASLSEAVGIAKAEAGLPIYDPAREKQLVDLLAPHPGPVRDAYQEVIRVCREYSQLQRGEARLPRPDDGGDPGAPA